MRKKVIDIYPPCNEEATKLNPCKGEEGNKSCSKKWILLALFLVLIFAGYFYYVSYRTEIVIYPLTEDVQIEENILVRSFGSIDEGEIRGMILSKNVSKEEQFPVEGRRMVEEKAEGEIKVCQQYRDTQAPFVEGTRFISDNGKIFFAKEGFTLPPRNVNEGCAMVSVIAAEAGEDYNIPADSKFALPGLQGTAIYGDVKGHSITIKKEGVLREVPYLDDESMERAEAQMKEELFQKGKELLKEEYGEEYFIDDENQYITEIVERSLLEENDTDKEDGEADNFYYKLDVRVKVIALSREYIDNFIKSSLPENYTWRKDTEEIEITFRRINFEDGEADIGLIFSAQIHEDIDKERAKRDVVGLDFEEAEKILQEKLKIEEAIINTKPFGLSRVAKSFYRVEVVLRFDKN
jgi:hypothetical protein